jgi:hypothetical protein
MITTEEEIRTWLEKGKEMGATHVVVACDTFDYEDFPVYVLPDQDVNKVVDKYNNQDKMLRVMEVYSLKLDIEDQLKSQRSYHLD